MYVGARFNRRGGGGGEGMTLWYLKLLSINYKWLAYKNRSPPPPPPPKKNPKIFLIK